MSATRPSHHRSAASLGTVNGGLTEEQAAPVVPAICSDPKRWGDFMMRYELGLEAPDPRRAPRGALTIALSCIVGGLIPLCPYMRSHTVLGGLWVSVVLTLAALLVFGYVMGPAPCSRLAATRSRRWPP
jgi:vacuolar iron transporter family protein